MKRFYWVDELNQMSQEEILRYQEKKLPKQLKYCYDNSELYKQKFDDAGAAPEDINTIDDLRQLPVFMVKDDERKSAEASLQKYGHPFGLHLCAPVEDISLPTGLRLRVSVKGIESPFSLPWGYTQPP